MCTWVYSKTMWNKQRNCFQLQSHVWIANFRGENRKASILWESSYFFMVLWYGRPYEEMCGAILASWQTKRLNNSTKYLFHAWTTTTSKKKKWNLLEICHMYALKLFWNAYTWHELDDLILYVSEQICTIVYKMDQSLWQTIMSFDLLHSSYMWIQTVLLCG